MSFDPARFAALEALDLRARYVMEGFLDGVHGSPFHGPSVEFADVRDYQPGDDLRHVDWRLYARRDRLVVKRYERETNARAFVLLDTSASMAYRGEAAWGSKLDAARVFAAALSWLLLRQHDAVGLLALETSESGRGESNEPSLAYLRPSSARPRLGELMGRLRRVEARGEAGLADLLERAPSLLRRRALVFVLSDLLDPSEDASRAFERLRFDGHDVRVLQVLDRDEIDLPFAEGTVLEDLETGLLRQVDEGARRRYRERFDAFQARWDDLLKRLAVPRAVARTDADPARSLVGLLRPGEASGGVR